MQRSVNEWVNVYIVMEGCMLFELKKKKKKNTHNEVLGEKKDGMHGLLSVTYYQRTTFDIHHMSPPARLHVVGMLRFISDINQPSLPPPFLFCSWVYFCLYGPFDCTSFHQFSRQLSVFWLCSSGLISALLVLLTIFLYESLLQPCIESLVVDWT